MNADNLLEELDAMISSSEKRIENCKKIKEQVKKLVMYEVGIRKSDNAVFYFEFNLEPFSVGPLQLSIRATRMPTGNSQILILTIADFEKDFVQYSNKARAILPKM